MKEKFTKEHIDEVILDVLNENNPNITKQLNEEFLKLNPEYKNNPMCLDVLSISIAQTNAINIIKDVLYRLLNE